MIDLPANRVDIRGRDSNREPAWAAPFFQSISNNRKKGRRRVGTAASLQNSCLEGSIPSRPAILSFEGAHVPQWRHCLASSVWRVQSPWLPPISNDCFSKHTNIHDCRSPDRRSQKIWRPGVTRQSCRKAGKGTATLSVRPDSSGTPRQTQSCKLRRLTSDGTMLEDGRCSSA